MYFGPRYRAVGELHRGDSLLLAPVAKSVTLPQHCKVTNAVSFGNRFDRFNRSNNLKIHRSSLGDTFSGCKYSHRQALAAWIDQEEERDRLTREALADVDTGRIIDHQAVQAWADRLNTDQALPIPR